MDPMFVIVLIIGTQQFISVEEYTEPTCNKLAVIATLNTNIKASCIPNYKDVPDEEPGSVDPGNYQYPFRPPSRQPG